MLYYEFRQLRALCEKFDKLKRTLRGEKQKPTDPYPWLAEDDERRNLSDREISETYVNLETSCLTQKKKDELMEFLYKYKDAFSLRNEIDTCPNIEVEIDMVDKFPLCHKSLSCEGGGSTGPGKRDKKVSQFRYTHIQGLQCFCNGDFE